MVVDIDTHKKAQEAALKYAQDNPSLFYKSESAKLFEDLLATQDGEKQEALLMFCDGYALGLKQGVEQTTKGVTSLLKQLNEL